MSEETPQSRMIAMGSAALMQGFALIGFETYPDADVQAVETVLEQLVREDARALLLLEDRLARSEGPWLKRVRNEGGGIVITELPALNQPEAYRPLVEELVTAILGPRALE
jgi:vacuolar-type H+-ATPase subunit F/Vma7